MRRMLVGLSSWCVLLWVFALLPRAQAAAPVAKSLPGLALASHRASIGNAIPAGNLTVFPIYAEANPKFADAIALDKALARKKARVREQGADDAALEGAEVGTLVIDNLGGSPIVVLAGTVVKGGKQDRQIGQDFVIAAHSSADVEAFCVEQGRWSGEREGKNTGGSFAGSGMIAPSSVRVAAQYESDQGKVWNQVAETNQRSAKTSESGTLMATYDDAEMVAKRKAVAAAIELGLAGDASTEQIMGLAYAVDGDIRGVRWFASRTLFEQHRKQLLETMAMEALLATPRDAAVKRPLASAVRAFIDGVGSSDVKASKKRPKSMNTNVYRESPRAYSSEARLDPSDPYAAPVTVDITAK